MLIQKLDDKWMITRKGMRFKAKTLIGCIKLLRSFYKDKEFQRQVMIENTAGK